jgi:hypothetical protein
MDHHKLPERSVKTEEETPAFISLSSLEGPARQGKEFTLTSPTQSLLPHLQGFFLWVTKQGTLDETARERAVQIDEHRFVTIRSHCHK